jgi:hypothetical protein
MKYKELAIKITVIRIMYFFPIAIGIHLRVSVRNVFVFIILSLFASCNTPEKLISCTWKIKDVVMTKDGRPVTDVIQGLIKQQMIENTKLIVGRKDSSYTILQIKENNATPGKWWFSKDKKELFTHNETNDIDAKIIELKKESLIMESKTADGKVIRLVCVPATN